MSARSCQLCGKPLSRLRVGGDGDFCSREHRNQHRLRAGMGRLEEANKVTSLMRRRENPRHISPERLMCNSALDPRGFFEPKQRERKSEAPGFSVMLRGPAPPRVAGAADRYVQTRAPGLRGAPMSPRADASVVRINGRGTLPLIPRRSQKLPARISPASLVTLSCERAAEKGSPRDFGMLRHGEMRVYLGDASLAPAARQRTQANSLSQQTQLRTIKSVAVEGSALRVSSGMGFRVGAAKAHDLTSQAPPPAALVWPLAMRRVGPGVHDSAAPHRNFEKKISTLSVRLPVVVNAKRPAQVVFPGTLRPRNQRPAAGEPQSQRPADVCWKPSEPVSRRMAVRPPSAGFAKRNGAHLTVAVTPSSTHPAQLVAFAAFIPQEPVGCPKVSFEGTVAAAIVNSPVIAAGGEPASRPARQAAPAAAIRIEEHFESGWDHWMGGTDGWKVDVAGVRTGPLALFVPSLELIDYDLEFLARIDTHSITWVVRAAGLEEYVRCTLTAIAGGELEFSRCAVVGGVAETPVTGPERLPGKPRATMTVRTRVAGDHFTVSVDGNNIGTWHDDRFPMGGIGFSGVADDRARLYWVRLTSTEFTTREYQK